MTTGRLIGIGVGPGDPDLITLKALRCLRDAPVVAYVAAGGQPSMARQIAAPHLPQIAREINLALPMHPRPELASAAFDEGASRIAAELEDGSDVAVLCEGDPLFYGSFVHILSRLGAQYRTEIVPGITAISAAAATTHLPLLTRSETLIVVPATLPRDALAARLRDAESAAILKLGRHLDKLRGVLHELGLMDRAVYVERASTGRQRVMSLADHPDAEAPYFALVMISRSGLR